MSKDLAQMGTAKVVKTQHSHQAAIAKHNASEVEIQFYQHAAPKLREAGANTPDVYQVNPLSRVLVLEHIPSPISAEALFEEPKALAHLTAIHTLPPSHIVDTENCEGEPPSQRIALHTHKWSQHQTDTTFECLSLPAHTMAFIETIRADCQRLFDTNNLISGDSNHGNWGVRENGELVQFDWERFGYGSPAIDLAPMIPKMGTRDQYKTIAARYAQFNPYAPTDEILRQVVYAKIWIITEVVNLLEVRNNPVKQRYIDWFNQQLPQWTKTVQAWPELNKTNISHPNLNHSSLNNSNQE